LNLTTIATLAIAASALSACGTMNDPKTDHHAGMNAAQQCVIYSSTMGEYSQFNDAFKPLVIAGGAGFGVLAFSLASLLGAPLLFIFGLVGGFSSPMHFVIPQMVGALFGRFYFQRKMGLVWRQYIPVVAAGFFCGAGLITLLGVGIMFVSKAVIAPPF
jgi:hypothetical protein